MRHSGLAGGAAAPERRLVEDAQVDEQPKLQAGGGQRRQLVQLRGRDDAAVEHEGGGVGAGAEHLLEPGRDGLDVGGGQLSLGAERDERVGGEREGAHALGGGIVPAAGEDELRARHRLPQLLLDLRPRRRRAMPTGRGRRRPREGRFGRPEPLVSSVRSGVCQLVCHVNLRSSPGILPPLTMVDRGRSRKRGSMAQVGEPHYRLGRRAADRLDDGADERLGLGPLVVDASSDRRAGGDVRFAGEEDRDLGIERTRRVRGREALGCAGADVEDDRRGCVAGLERAQQGVRVDAAGALDPARVEQEAHELDETRVAARDDDRPEERLGQ